MAQKHDIAVLSSSGEMFGIKNVEFNLDAEKRIVYLFNEDGISYINFDQCLQVGATPARGE